MDIKFAVVVTFSVLLSGCAGYSDTHSPCYDKASAKCHGNHMNSGPVLNDRGQIDHRMQQVQQRGQQDNSTDGGARFGW
ncbi:hypothetical protein NE897_01960 [Yersinia ruckeri]|uniref:Lipoprotein n=1 Tax=Yersinia ruckeri TaxID=29486 RepID=A0A085U628_YERRU|nr:hypothetical protein [Yersinia ruckeri]AKA37506.1 hypothetical protein UGYR_03235 [Yersinia ruckeri]ARZ00695.1 hypothetical protein QMA0440_01355 [Yersinia ruckeri]AUQ42873.1 hypothetical protein NJ56_13755 [Yersinia ruckeri]EEP98550.1 hypothetical protein yruck0001_12080 [Yersinia ruckeri ATCC 29473]EKN3346549.1 hypothetical protein [Yersinia ruckeri]